MPNDNAAALVELQAALNLIVPEPYRSFLLYLKKTKSLHKGDMALFSLAPSDSGASEILERNQTYEIQKYFPGFLFIADTGGADHFVLECEGPKHRIFRAATGSPFLADFDFIADSFEAWQEAGFKPYQLPDWEMDPKAPDSVDVMLLRPPKGGLKLLRNILTKERVTLPVSQIADLAKNTPSRLLANCSYSDAAEIVRAVNRNDPCLELTLPNQPKKTVSPEFEPQYPPGHYQDCVNHYERMPAWEPHEKYQAIYEDFRWKVPARYNIGVDVADKHTRPFKTALIVENDDASVTTYTFDQLKQLSDKLALALAGLGVNRGDRVAILLPQSLETAVAHIAVYKLGAIALPLFTLFGPDALEYRLNDSGAKALITDNANLAKVMDLKKNIPGLQTVVVTGAAASAGVHAFDSLISQAQGTFAPADTLADDPALIIYTSGTTGNPKGALHAHRTLLGHLPGVEIPHEFFGRPSDLFWTPADWAWIGGLLDVLLPSLHHGVPVLAHRMKKFDPEHAFHLLAKHKVKNAFLPPTALKLMRQATRPQDRHAYKMRSIGSGGETLGSQILDWGMDTFGLKINEFYGQTECNLVVGNCASIMPVKPGSMGRAIPGHTLAIIDDNGHPLPDGTEGHIAVKRPDPVMFLGYWNNPKATTEKFIGDWLLTGDRGRRDADGYYWYIGRGDDVITSAGYRIGPAEVEDSILKFPGVSMAAVIGKPCPIRTELVKAFVVLTPGTQPSDALASQIQNHVKMQLAAHEYPREIEFVTQLPMTTTGKIMRRVLRQREVDKAASQSQQ